MMREQCAFCACLSMFPSHMSLNRADGVLPVPLRIVCW